MTLGQVKAMTGCEVHTCPFSYTSHPDVAEASLLYRWRSERALGPFEGALTVPLVEAIDEIAHGVNAGAAFDFEQRKKATPP